MSRVLSLVLPAAATVLLAGAASDRPPAAGPVDPRLFAGLSWRNVGPFRAGRIAAVTGVIGQPGVFYVGLPAAGVWKTTSAGRTWYPVFDSITAISSIGAIEVAPSDPNVIYAGSGDMPTGGAINEGNGMYKSIDAGRSWIHIGLDSSKQIPSILVDPQDPNVVLVAAQGDIHKQSESRGIYRSADGGRTWTRTLFVDQTTGAQKLARAFDTPNVIYATTDRHYVPPTGQLRAGGQVPDSNRTGTYVYKSTNGGVTWTQLTGGGLPRLAGRTSIAVANHTSAQRVFLISNSGLYRSDDGGASWRQMAADDERIRNGQGGYNCGVYVDPQNPDIVYTLNTSSYKSTDGGNTFTGFRGAPGGDDPQQLWIDPTNGQRMLFGFDQGAIVTLDGGQSWSSWYNQSTEQVYHLTVDNSYPYWIYATQQDAGAVRTRARGNLGEITPLDWSPVPGWEWGSIIADPLNPNIVYASGNGIVKISYPSEQWINVSPAEDPSLELRTAFSQPIIFAPWNQHELIAGFQYLMATTDGGAHWKKMSPDLGVPKAAPAAQPRLDTNRVTTPRPTPPRGGAIETISASTVKPGVIWVGTNNGLIKVTRDDGKTWEDATIPDLPNPTRALISIIDASHHDPATAYVAVDLHGTGDYAPHFYRTRDYGKTWTVINKGLPTDQPSGSFSRVIRADPKRQGLLFAGTESGMYVSFDDGDDWESLQLNLPNTSYRDLAIKGSDLVVGTYGRGIWVLDDYSALQQVAPTIASEPAHLYQPADAIRVRRNVGADTPFPLDVPHAKNPREGMAVDYWLASNASNEVSLDVLDAQGKLVRHMSSAPVTPVAEAARPPEPSFWLATPESMPATAGSHRVNWNLRYDAPPAFTHSFEINANPGETPPSPEGPLVPPGTYTLKLTVDGKSYTRPVTVKNDPRSPATVAAIRAQSDLNMRIYDGLKESYSGYQRAMALRAAVAKSAGSSAPADVSAEATKIEAQIDSIAGNPRRGGGFVPFGARNNARPTFVSVNNAFVQQINGQDNGDIAPTPGMLAALTHTSTDLKSVNDRLAKLEHDELPVLNSALGKANLPTVSGPQRQR